MTKSKDNRKKIPSKPKSDSSINGVVLWSSCAAVVMAAVFGYTFPWVKSMVPRLNRSRALKTSTATPTTTTTLQQQPLTSSSPRSQAQIAQELSLAKGLKVNLIRAGYDNVDATRVTPFWLSHEDYSSLVADNSRFFDINSGLRLREWAELVDRAPSPATSTAPLALAPSSSFSLSASSSASVVATGPGNLEEKGDGVAVSAAAAAAAAAAATTGTAGTTAGTAVFPTEWGRGEALDLYFDPGPTWGKANQDGKNKNKNTGVLAARTAAAAASQHEKEGQQPQQQRPAAAIKDDDDENNDELEQRGRAGLARDGNGGGVPFIWPPNEVGHTVVLEDICGGGEVAIPRKGKRAKRCVPPRGKDSPVTLETLSESPKAFYVHNFLSDEEADNLVSFAQDAKNNPYALRPSTTGHKSWTEGGDKSTNSQRTSLNGFDISSATGFAVKRRAFELARIEPFYDGMADGIQVLRYEPSQAYVPHTDYFAYHTSPDHDWDPRNGNGTNRFATVFLYLSDVESGGETVFPKKEATAAQQQQRKAPSSSSSSSLLLNSPTPPSTSTSVDTSREETTPTTTAGEAAEAAASVLLSEGSWEADMAKTCRSQFAVKPKKGDALLFYSQQPDGSLDEMSFHGGCPVLKGTKWAANVWIWNGCRYSICENKPK